MLIERGLERDSCSVRIALRVGYCYMYCFLSEYTDVNQLMYHHIQVQTKNAFSWFNIMNVYHLTKHGQLEPKFVLDFGGNRKGTYFVCYWENRWSHSIIRFHRFHHLCEDSASVSTRFDDWPTPLERS
jgi:hypothetical protein